MSNWSSGYVSTNGINLHYHRSGGDKPPVVLAHGITDSGLCWTRVAQALEKEYDLIMVDARGHGLSDAPDSGYAMSEHAADLAGLIQSLGLEKVAVLGHSMGAGSTTSLAANYPELVQCAILEDPPWREESDGSDSQKMMEGLRQWLQHLTTLQDQPLADVVALCQEQNPTWDESEHEPWALSKQQVNPNVLDFVRPGAKPWAELIPQIICPTLLITSDVEAGAIVEQETAQRVVDMNSNIRWAHIPGAGHNIRREQFEEFVMVVTGFLAEVHR